MTLQVSAEGLPSAHSAITPGWVMRDGRTPTIVHATGGRVGRWPAEEWGSAMAFAVHGMGLTQPARAAREAPEVTVVSSPAELDCNTARVLVERVMEALAGNDGQPIVVELATVQFIDASGLRVLFGCRDLAARVGRPLTYREPSPAVLRLAEIFEDVALLLRAA